MLGRLILIALQLAIAWFGAPYLLKYLPLTGDPALIAHGAIFGVIVWIVGLVGSQALKDVAMPTSPTLLWAVGGGLVGSALILLKVPAMLPVKFHPMFLPLGLAVLGYAVKR
jgi:hypothetical protein